MASHHLYPCSEKLNKYNNKNVFRSNSEMDKNDLLTDVIALFIEIF